VNTDIVGMPTGRYESRDSNPGHVRTSSGGVARNIAENLVRLGARVRLVSSFGDDDAGAALASECEDLGIDTSHSVVARGVPGSRYLAVLDAAGDLAAAVNDMRALDALTRGTLDPAAFEGADAVVLDTNLRASAVVRAAELAGQVPVVLDPVSTAKAPAARPVLHRLAAIKANLREAEELSGAAGAVGAAARLLEYGVRRAFVTMGPDGVWCSDGRESLSLPTAAQRVVNATGAGDAFTAGVAWGEATGISLRETAELATRLSAIALASERTVSPEVIPAVLERTSTEGTER
jgi:pseudouridine kinase